MKRTIKGVCYDTDNAAPKCCFRHGKPPGSIIETSYYTNDGRYFLLQEVDGEKTIIPMTFEDMGKWSTGGSGKPFAKK